MKKLLTLILCFSFVFCLCGCGDKEENDTTKEEKDTVEETTEDTTVTEDTTETMDETVFDLMIAEIPEEAEFSYYYVNAYKQIQSSDLYGDYNEQTIHEYAVEDSIKAMAARDYYLEKAKAEGFVGSSAIQEEVSDVLNQIKKSNESSGDTLEESIKLLYGETMNVEFLRSLLLAECLIAEYIDMVERNLVVTDEELYEYRELYADEFLNTDLRLFGFETDAYGEDEAAELAQEMCDRITDEQSFVDLAYEYCLEQDKYTFRNDGATLAKCIKKSSVARNIGEDLADWLYAEERQVGEKRVYSTDDYVYVVYILNTAYFEETPLVDARHILISFAEVVKELNTPEGNGIDTSLNYDRETETLTLEDGMEITNENTGYSIELIEEAYNQAKAVYEEYLEGEKNEESFAEFAEAYSDDMGSIGQNTLGGGLYEDIEKGTMVKPFEDWIYDENRKTGDVDIIMTEFGWHIMYFVKQHDEPDWKSTSREILTFEKFELLMEEYDEDISEIVKEYAETLPIDEYSEKAFDLV